MKSFKAVGLALAAVGLLLGSVVHADGESQKLQKDVEKKVDYLDRLTRFERNQIQLAQVALQHSQQPRVREFANRLIKDHEGSLKSIRTWADGRALQISALDEEANQGTGGSGNVAQTAIPQTSAKGAQANVEFSKKAEQKRLELAALEPGEFDKEFLSAVVESQEQGKQLLEKGRDEFEGDLTLVSVLAKNAPALDAHIAHAKSLKDSL